VGSAAVASGGEEPDDELAVGAVLRTGRPHRDPGLLGKLGAGVRVVYETRAGLSETLGVPLDQDSECFPGACLRQRHEFVVAAFRQPFRDRPKEERGAFHTRRTNMAPCALKENDRPV
jgi:hypothetical protein